MNIYIFVGDLGIIERDKNYVRMIRNIGGKVTAFCGIKVAKQSIDVDGNEIPYISVLGFNEIDNDDIFLVSDDKFLEAGYKLKMLGFRGVYKLFNLNDDSTLFLPPREEMGDYTCVAPFNYYESPYHVLSDIRKRKDILFDTKKEMLDVDFNVEGQIAFVNILAEIKEPLFWSCEPKEKNGYYYNNSWFDKGGADALYYMIMHFQPHSIIEIGSGFSTAAMLDINEHMMENKINIQCIEPRPDRLRETIKQSDNIKLNMCNLQDVKVEFFDQLNENDILFIDSSHVCKTGSDVSMEIFEILPRLNSGVIIHVHDIFWPLEYPYEWLKQGRAYNEAFLFHAFLMNNNKYEVILFGNQLLQVASGEIPFNMVGIGNGSLWLRKK